MAPPAIDDTQGWVTYLSRLHDAELRDLKQFDNEYQLKAPRQYMHPEIFREIGDRLQQVVIAWPMLVVDALEERLDVEGFRLPDEGDDDADLWRVWQENDLDEASQLAHIDALVMRRAYIAVGTNEADDRTPLVTCESPLEVFADVDPRTRQVRAALRRYTNQYAFPAQQATAAEAYATLYLPNVTVFYERSSSAGGQYNEVDRDQHGLGVVPLVPLVNRARLADWSGRSELSPILPLAHAANKIATDMMVAAEFVALPLRGIFGVGPQDFEDQLGNKLTALQAMLGRLLTIPDDDGTAKQFEFTSANLSNFHETINRLAQLVASLAGLPPHYLGLTTDNPASADAIRSAEIRLIKRAERRQRAFGGSWEQAMRLVRRFQTGEWDPALRRLETVWRDASTPTVAESADAAMKLFNLPQPIVPLRMTREKLGFSDAQIDLMEAEDKASRAQQLEDFKLASETQAAAGGPANNAAGPEPATPVAA